ncbi:MAG: thiol-activated cytolysin family protein [Saprospiraceae bacterium]|nr:thiol-activated cytolysin family protein [Saprospiraceae bacterium]
MNTNISKILVLLILFVSCGKDSSFSTFKDAINSGGDFDPVNTSETTESLGETETTEGEEVWTCTSTKVSVEDALGGENGFSLFSPNANVVYPGNLIQGASLYKASPDEILAKRSGGEITISILDGADVSSVEIEEVTLGKVTTAANQILNGKDAESVIPANFQFSKSIIQSEKEFALRVKADYDNAWASVSGSLSFSNNSTYSRMMVTLQQTFYTLSFTAPYNVEGFFAPDADPEDLERFIGPGNPPCYISSVNYGRIFYMLIESSASESELSAAVEASFEGLTSSGGGSVEVDNFENIEEVNIKIFALGGDAATTLGAGGITKNNLGELNDILVKATDIRTAVPISFKAQSVKTNEVVAVQLATDYEKKTCYVTSALPPLVITEHWANVKEMLGSPVGAVIRMNINNEVSGGPSVQIFVDTTGTRVVYDDGEKLYTEFETLEGVFGDQFTLDDVSAGCVHPEGTYWGGIRNHFIVINKRGNKAVRTNSSNQFTEAHNLGDFNELKYWKNEGIGAICSGPKDTNTLWVVNKAGTVIHAELFDGEGNNNILANLPTAVLTGGYVNNQLSPGFFTEGISGITNLGDNLFATIDKAGNRYMIADFSNAQNIRYWGPFKL